MDERLKRLIARREQASKDREQLLAQRKAIVDLAEQEAREDLTAEEDTEFRDLTAKVKAKDEEISSFDERISELYEEQKRQAAYDQGTANLRRAVSQAQITAEARTYERGNGRSYFRDLVLVQSGMDGTGDCAARLRRHADEVRNDRAFAEFRALDRTDGDGGFVKVAAAAA